MKVNDVLRKGDTYLRVLAIKDEYCFCINCNATSMPVWMPASELEAYTQEEAPTVNTDLTVRQKQISRERFTLIASILAFLTDDAERNRMLRKIADEYDVSKQTLRRYLCKYLAYQDIAVLAPVQREQKSHLTQDQKNMRWALNKFFYTTKKSKLTEAYVHLLKEKYSDAEGNLLPEYPSIRQFRYFESQYRKQENYLISRNGLKNYQRNDRPLLGEGIQEFAPNIGVGMLDATVCDIYLVNKEGLVVGRPILVAGVDANTSLCMGYSLLWEGGVYSLQQLMLNIVSDKVELCRKMGIVIEERQWPVSSLPGVMVTDMGSEFVGGTFEQITELGVTLINLPSFRPDLKGGILSMKDDLCFCINCNTNFMPVWMPMSTLDEYTPDTAPMVDKNITAKQKQVAHERYTMIAPMLAFLTDDKERNRLMNRVAAEQDISKQTLRKYICRYLVYQDIAALAPAVRETKQELTQDQKHMRWALNKYFYTPKKTSLADVYVKLLKEKYCDEEGNLPGKYPSIRQFRYFEQKYRKQENYLISRNGLKSYQRNDRPLLGEGVQEYAPYIGVGMLDATICDIYLVNKEGLIVGRPILVAGVDANTSLCMGYSLLWEGGVYSLQQLMLNIVSNKVDLCRKIGIAVEERQWPVSSLPGVMVTDMGSEYIGETFEQITELGVTLISLPAFRPDLKGPIEKLFDLVQEKYKDALKGKGVIMPDFQERGAHDYRKDACLTLEEFERIVVRCMFYINQAVDIYNLISLESKLALGAHNIDRVDGNVTLRFTDGSERFVPIGQTEPIPVAPHEYCYCDDANEVLCRLEIRQVEKTKVDEEAQNVFYIVQGNEGTSDELLHETAQTIIDLTVKFCGGTGRVIVPKVIT